MRPDLSGVYGGYDVVGKGVGLPRRQKVAIRLLIESGCAKTPSEAAVPAFSGWLLTRSGVWRKRRSLVAGTSFKGRKEGGR